MTKFLKTKTNTTKLLIDDKKKIRKTTNDNEKFISTRYFIAQI